MSLADQARFNIAHSIWALEELIRHAETLPADKLEQDLGIGPGGLRENIAHTIEAMFFFADNFAGSEYAERPTFQSDSKTIPGLRRLLAAAGEDLRRSMLPVCSRPLPATIKWPNADRGELPAVAAIAQVFDHPALHRTQCINMLKRLGIRPVPDLDPMTFQATGLPW